MDRFDLENKITELYSIVDSLNDISYGIIEGGLSRDESANAIDGLAVVTKMKLEKLFDVFTQVFFLNQYNPNYSDVCCDENEDTDALAGWN